MSPTKKGKQNGQAKKKVEFKGFFNPRVNKELKTAVRSLSMDSNAILERYGHLISQGFKVSAICDEAQTHFTLSLYDSRISSPSAGYVLSVKHSEIGVAISLVWFLCEEVYQRGAFPVGVDGGHELDW